MLLLPCLVVCVISMCLCKRTFYLRTHHDVFLFVGTFVAIFPKRNNSICICMVNILMKRFQMLFWLFIGSETFWIVYQMPKPIKLNVTCAELFFQHFVNFETAGVSFLSLLQRRWRTGHWCCTELRRRTRDRVDCTGRCTKGRRRTTSRHSSATAGRRRPPRHRRALRRVAARRCTYVSLLPCCARSRHLLPQSLSMCIIFWDWRLTAYPCRCSRLNASRLSGSFSRHRPNRSAANRCRDGFYKISETKS